MITSAEIKKKALRKYTDYLRNVAAGITFQQIEIPCDKKASDTIAEYQKEYNDIRSLSKEVKGYGYSIEWKTVKNKMLGTQDFPSKIKFETAEDFERFLQKTKEVADFRKNVALINGKFPELQYWIERYPQKIIDNSEDWNDILKVLDYFSKNPQPQLYIRELPIEVHTKFIEQHKALIGELLDIVIKEYINTNEKEFEKRYNLRYDEPTVRMRLLDRTLAKKLFYGLDDITIPVSLFLKLQIPISKVYIGSAELISSHRQRVANVDPHSDDNDDNPPVFGQDKIKFTEELHHVFDEVAHSRPASCCIWKLGSYVIGSIDSLASTE